MQKSIILKHTLVCLCKIKTILKNIIESEYIKIY